MSVTDETLNKIHCYGMLWSNLKSVPKVLISCICMEERELLDQWLHFAPAWVHGFL